MNNRMLVGGGALVLILIGGYFLQRATYSRPAAPTPSLYASSTGATATSTGSGGTQGTKPTFTQGAPIKTIVHITLAFDAPTFTSTSSYPVLSGMGGNVTSADILINDSRGKGIVTANIPIKEGRWIYYIPRALAPGTYTALLSNQGLIVKATLTVEK